MEQSKVLEFPKENSMKVRLQNKNQERKAVAALSIASVLIVSVFLNQWMSTSSEVLTTDGNRNIASYAPAVAIKDVQWEQALAKNLVSKEVSAQLAEAPTLRDDLIFGRLEGKYGIKMSKGKIQTLEFIDAQAGDQPLAIVNKVDFLKKYAGAFGHAYSEVGASEDEQTFHLIGPRKEIIGQAKFKVDDQGRVEALQFIL